jgi:CRISPR/Cas system-associated exonuclease Cas4 (RecB family)
MIAALDPLPAVQRVFSQEAQPSKARTKEELLRSVSASRLGTWLQCRLKFKFRYLDGIAKPPTPALHVGSVIHTVLQQWSLARWRRVPLDDETVGGIFNHAWQVWQEEQDIAWDGEEDSIKANAVATLRLYLRETPIPPDEKPEAVEVGVEMDLASHGLPMLVGILDLVRQGGRIVDFKTTGKTPDPEMLLHTTEVQLTAYAMLYREATGRRESGIELHHLVRLKTPKIVITEAGPATERQISRFFHLAESYVRGLEAEDFVPSPGFACAACDYFKECRAWR